MYSTYALHSPRLKSHALLNIFFLGTFLMLANIERRCVFLAIVIKLLLIPAYVSTDFEVHRNWLAITHNLPLSKWYFDTTSPWTLDYPPFFAYFEFILARIGYFGSLLWYSWLRFNRLVIQASPILARFYSNGAYSEAAGYPPFEVPAFLRLVEQGDEGDLVGRVFQKMTVLVLDLFLVYAVKRFASTVPVLNSLSRHNNNSGNSSSDRIFWFLVLTVLSPLLLMIDHIHFQYNGFLIAILVLSVTLVFEGREDLGAIAFSTLLNLKHLFLYISPVYFVYYVRKFVLIPALARAESRVRSGGVANANYDYLSKLVYVAVCTLLPFVLSLWPFRDQLPQLVSRLFPFDRGLLHAYWAPNFWALYAAGDRALIRILPRLGFTSVAEPAATLTRGIVGDISFTNLPNVTSRITFYLTLFFQLPILIKLWIAPNVKNFLTSIIICAFASFYFGWHVHEKAILIVLFPLYLYVLMNNDKRVFGWIVALTMMACVSFFPLFIEAEETFVKIVMSFAFSLLLFLKLDCELTNWEKFYLLTTFRMSLFTEQTINRFSEDRAFLPLLLNSSVCALANGYIFIRLYLTFMRRDEVTESSADNDTNNQKDK